jgi:hypothetical protein
MALPWQREPAQQSRLTPDDFPPLGTFLNIPYSG